MCPIFLYSDFRVYEWVYVLGLQVGLQVGLLWDYNCDRHGRGRAVCFSVARGGDEGGANNANQKKMASKFFGAMLAPPSKIEKHRVRPRKHYFTPRKGARPNTAITFMRCGDGLAR